MCACAASGQEACAPAGAVDFFGSNVHRGLRFVRDDDDSSGSEHEMEEDEDAVRGPETPTLTLPGCFCASWLSTVCLWGLLCSWKSGRVHRLSPLWPLFCVVSAHQTGFAEERSTCCSYSPPHELFVLYLEVFHLTWCALLMQAGRKGGDAAGAQARAATAQQEYQALALENQRLSAEVALLRSALLAARQGSAGAVEPPLRDKDELELSTRNAALLFATAPA